MSLADEHIQQIIYNYGGNFTPDEFLSGRENANPDLIKEIVWFRNVHGFPTFISSLYRDSGAHSIGAVDQFIFSDYRQEQPDPMHLWRLANMSRFTGVGIYFDTHAFGEPAIMLHLDILTQKDCDRLYKIDGKQRKRPLRWLRSEGNYYYQNPAHGKFWCQDKQEMTTLEQEINTYLANSD